MPERSPWVWVRTEGEGEHLVSQQFLRKVGDGYLSALVSFSEVLGWHMAVAFVSRGEAMRYPTWEETLDAGEQLLPVGIVFVVALQRNVHDFISAMSIHQADSPLNHLPPGEPI